jgi:hypothetical protein
VTRRIVVTCEQEGPATRDSHLALECFDRQRRQGNFSDTARSLGIGYLDASHIVPYLGPETNHPSNGLILRADIHALFDLGLITIDPDSMTVVVAPSLRRSDYASLEGMRLRQPIIPCLHRQPRRFRNAGCVRTPIGKDRDQEWLGTQLVELPLALGMWLLHVAFFSPVVLWQ